MSVCYNLNCHDCQEYIWIGQGGSCFYYGEPETMAALGKFLYKHQGHKLSFDDDNQFEDYKDYQKKECVMPVHTEKERKKNRSARKQLKKSKKFKAKRT